MGLDSKVSIVFPYQIAALLNAMGIIWNFTKGHSNPIENQIRYTRVIMGMVWDYCIYHPSNKYYGEYMELYEIRSHPI